MSDNVKNINWYPGHMTKAKRMMQENIKLIDIIIELVDARLPLSSKNPDIDALSNGKYRLVLLGKKDMADEAITKKWLEYFENSGIRALAIDSRSRRDMKQITDVIMEQCKEKIERDRRKGIKNRPIRAMVAGVPNVGKSTFINSFAGRAVTKTGNKPGVTKGKQWIKLSKSVELLDTPGLLWPKFEDQNVAARLALSGSINDDILDIYDLSIRFADFMSSNYPKYFSDRYGLSSDMAADQLIEEVGLQRGCLEKGGTVNKDKAAKALLDDFRSLKLGRISLERPDDQKWGF